MDMKEDLSMRTVIVFYSMSENCAYTAEKIAALTGADLLRIEPEKAYPDSGFKKFFWAGKSAVMGEAPALKPYTFGAENYDRVIFGFPVWAGTMAPPIRTFIRENSAELTGKKIAAFTCMSGKGGGKALENLRSLLGKSALEAELILIDPKEKLAPENEESIKAFCEKLS